VPQQGGYVRTWAGSKEAPAPANRAVGGLRGYIKSKLDVPVLGLVILNLYLFYAKLGQLWNRMFKSRLRLRI
jgi:hypothetical protein